MWILKAVPSMGAFWSGRGEGRNFGRNFGRSFKRKCRAYRNAVSNVSPSNNPHCPSLNPDPMELCDLARNVSAIYGAPPDDAVKFCRARDPTFVHLLRPYPGPFEAAAAEAAEADAAQAEGCDPHAAVLEVFCDTRLEIVHIPHDYNSRAILNLSQPNELGTSGSRPFTTKVSENEMASLPRSSAGGKMICVSRDVRAVKVVCRKRNMGWYVPDFIANIRINIPYLGLTMDRGWLEYVCEQDNSGGDSHIGATHCHYITNLVSIQRFKFSLESRNRTRQGKLGEQDISDQQDGNRGNQDELTFVPKRRGQRNDNKRRYNVIALQIDSLARYQAITYMPRFQEFFNKRLKGKAGTEKRWRAIDMTQHNAYSDDTFPNLYAAFSGWNFYSYPRADNVAAENVKPGPWWHFAKRAGYTTFYGAQSVLQGLSFYKPPERPGWFDFSSGRKAADYILREAYDVSGLKFGYHPFDGQYSTHCVSGKPAVKHLLDDVLWLSRSVRQHQDPAAPYFAAQLECKDLHNPNLNNAHMVDVPLTQFLRNIEEEGGYEDTILILNGDHGSRYGQAVGKQSLRLVFNSNPVFRLLLPSSLAAQIGEAVLDANQNIISHPLDVYATLRHIVGGGTALRYRTKAEHWGNNTKGLSVLQPLPRDRSCRACGIPESRCTCLIENSKVLFREQDAVKKVPSAMQAVYPRLVEAAVGQLSFLGGDGQVEGCPVPHVDKVLSLEVHERAESSQSDFLLVFSVKEDHTARFKALVPVQRRAKGAYVLDVAGVVGIRVTAGATGSSLMRAAEYAVRVDRMTKMRRSCSPFVRAAKTEALRLIDHVNCLC